MRTRVVPLLRDEAARYALRFACDDCVHHDAAHDRCEHGYPPGPRKDALDGDELTFCKEFELG
jgi:hypothetical protein